MNNDFATGSVTTTGHAGSVGGLVGSNDNSSSAQISASYSTGFLSAYTGSNVGGLVGQDTSGSTVTNSYFDTSTTGTTTGIGTGTTTGTTGLNDLQMMNASNFSSLSFFNTASSASSNLTNIWVMAGYPQLVTEATSNITNVVQLQLMEVNPAGSYTIANNINASATVNWNGGAGFTPVGNSTVSFTGYLNGLIAGSSNGAYVINNLYINTPSAASVGLFGVTSSSATIANVGLENAVITGSGGSGGNGGVGALIGYGVAAVNNGFSLNGTILATGTNSNAGGLFGQLNGGSIQNSYAVGQVTGVGNAAGFVGEENGATISNSYSGGTATGIIANAGSVGGFMGYAASGTVSNSYTTANVYVTATSSAAIGGFTGDSFATIQNAYSSGSISVSGSATAGGFVGINNGSISNIYWDEVSAPGYTTAIGSGTAVTNGTGITTTGALYSSGTYTNFTFGTSPGSGVWYELSGYTLPVLQMEYSTVINNAHQLQLMAEGLGANYSLNSNIDATATNATKDIWWQNGFIAVGYGYSGGPTNSPFTGSFNGQNYIINNLYENQATGNGTYYNVGLFGNVQFSSTSGYISNVGLTNVNMTGTFITSGLIGALAGNSGTITNDYITGAISASFNSPQFEGVGPLVGVLQGGTAVSNTYSTASVTVSNLGNNQLNIGGLVGYDQGAPVSYSYSSGRVTTSAAGGSGFIGNGPAGTLLSDFWDTATSGQSVGDGYNSTVTGLTGGCFYGSSCANGGTANLSAMSTYSGWNITQTVNTTATAPNNVWFIFGGATRPILLSEYNTNITNAEQLQLAGVATGASYDLGANVNAAATQTTAGNSEWGGSSLGFVPIGLSGSFTGNFNGNNHTISNLYTNWSGSTNIGVFAQTSKGASVENVGLVNSSIYGYYVVGGLIGSASGSGVVNNDYDIGGTVGGIASGGIVGINSGGGLISNSYNTSQINAAGNGGQANGTGGIVGDNQSGTVTDSYNLGYINGGNSYENIGGIAGKNEGTITSSYNAGSTIGYYYVGGLVGTNSGNIINNYNTGSVHAGNSVAGGLIALSNGGTVTNNFSAGLVTGGSNVGGFVGGYSAGSFSANIFDTGAAGTTATYGYGNTANYGSTFSTMSTVNPYSGGGWSIGTSFSSANTWGIIPGQSYPYLTAFYTAAPIAVTGTASGTGLTSGTGVALVQNGVSVGNTTTDANGFYYFLTPTNTTLTKGSPLLTYLSTGSTYANDVTMVPSTGASISGANLAANTIQIGDNNTNTLSTANMATTMGSLNTGYIIYSIASNNLTLGNTTDFNGSLLSTASTTLNLSGNISPSIAGTTTNSITFNGPIALGTNLTITNSGTTSSINILGNVNTNNYILSMSTATGTTNTISGIISGNGSNGNGVTSYSGYGAQNATLWIGGGGTVVLTGANTYSGLTSVFGGTLQIGSGATSSNVGTGALDLNGGTVISGYTGGTLTLANPFWMSNNATLGGNNPITFTGGGSFNYTLNVGNSSTTAPTAFSFTTTSIGENGYITINNNAILNLTAANTGNDAQQYGMTVLGGGTLNLNNVSALGPSNSSYGPSNIIVVGTLGLNLSGGTLADGTTQFTLEGGTIVGNGISNNSYIVTDGGTANSTTPVATTNTIGGTGNLTLSGTGTIASGDTLNITNTGTTTLGVLNGSTAGAGSLTSAAAAGMVTLGGVVGATKLNSITLGGLGTINTTAVSTSGAQTYNGVLFFGAANTTLTGTNLAFNNAIAATTSTLNPNLTITASGTVNFSGQAGTYAAQVLADNPTAYFPLNEGSGTTAYNLGTSGVNATLTLGNYSATSAYNDTGTAFIGTGAQATTASAVTSQTNNVSVTAWVDWAGSTTGNELLAYNGSGGGSGFGLYLTSNGTPEVLLGGVAFLNANSVPLTANTWTQLTAVDSGGVWTLYVNNAAGQHSYAVGSGTPNGGAAMTQIGSSSGDAFGGMINQVAFFNSALTSAQVSSLYSASAGLPFGSLTVTAGSGATFTGAPAASAVTAERDIVLTTNNQSYGATSLHSNSSFISNSSGSIAFSSTVAGTNDNLTFSTGGASSITGIFSGSGDSLTQSGAGTLTLSGVNTYTGATTFNAGTISIAADSGLGTAPGSATASNLIFNGGSLATTGSAVTLNSNRGISLLGSGGLVDTGTNALTYGGIIAGAGALTISGGGLVTLTGTNTYTGATTISGGSTLQLGLGSLASNIGTGILTLNNGTLELGYTGNAQAISNNITLGAGGGTFNPEGNVSALNSDMGLGLTGVISGTGGLTLADTGTGGVGILTLFGTNTYSGGTTINAGSIGAQGSSSVIGTITIGGSGTAGLRAENLNTTFTNAITANAGFVLGRGTTLSGNITLGGNITVTMNNPDGAANGNSTISSIISDGGHAYGVSYVNGASGIGTGALIISGANTYTGKTTIGTTVSIGADNNLGAAPGSVTTGDLIFNGGILQTTSTFTLSANRGISLTGAANLQPATGTTLTYGGIIAGSGALTETGTSTSGVTLSGVNTYTGTTTINNGILSIAADSGLGAAPGTATTGDLIFNNGGVLATTATFTLNANRGIALTGAGSIAPASGFTTTYNGILAGSGAFTEAGAGILALGGTNTYSGATAVSTGTLTLTSAGALGSTTGTSVASSASLNLGFSSNTTLSNTNTITLNGGTLSSNGAGNATLSNNVSLGGSNAFSYITDAGAGTMSMSGTITAAASSGAGLTISATTAGVGFALPAVNLSNGGSGQISVTTNGGAITQTAALNIAGNESFTAGASTITLNNTSNYLASNQAFTTTNGAVSFYNSYNTTLATTNLGTGALSITSVGPIVQTNGSLITAGNASLTTTTSGIGLSGTAFSGNVQTSATGVNGVGITNNQSMNIIGINYNGGAGIGYFATSAGNITIANAVTLPASSTLSLVSAGNTYLNGGISGSSATLNLTAQNAAQSITSGTSAAPSATGVTATISVGNFNLLAGQWYQTAIDTAYTSPTALPAFSATDFVLSSGSQFIRADSMATGTNAAGSSALNPYQIMDIYGLQGINSNATTLGWNYVLTQNINAAGTSTWTPTSGTGFAPIGTYGGTGFSGSLNGEGFAISNLIINDSTLSGVALFGELGGAAAIKNLTLINPTITGTNFTGGFGGHISGGSVTLTSDAVSGGTITGTNSYLGGLVGVGRANIINSSNSASIIGPSNNGVGGLVGVLFAGYTISGSYNTGTVTGSLSTNVGGLVGMNNGTINTSYNTGVVSGYNGIGGVIGLNSGTVSATYNTGAVTGTNASVGGFAGYNNGNISAAYSTGSVSGVYSSNTGTGTGGFVGSQGGGTITSSYSTGNVIGANGAGQAGGFVGWLNGGTVSNSYSMGTVTASGGNIGAFAGLMNYSGAASNNYYNTTTSFMSSDGSSATGLSDAQMMTSSNFTGFSFFNPTTSSNSTNYWVMAGYPHLAMENTSTITNVVQLQLMEVNPAGNYTLANNIDASATASWNGGAGFVPVGNGSIAFTGTLNGLYAGSTNGDYIINNLFINLPANNNVGMIGVTSGATISNVGLVNASITGGNYIGALVGYAQSGTINNDYSVATVTSAGGNAGGLIGQTNNDSITNSYSNSIVTAVGNVGGLVGTNNASTITTSYSGGLITITGTSIGSAGGLIGYGRVRDSY